eukprot:Plantae.Rhodophyta-Palmaria_palmata.ctg7756.p1 GENE.Plantae.Rhodophyta-Palmaria_palmata.ctg7756~~Plantae.Rhodophyta-Palmaria_palmata.ctg7756.p1  ORF type:complete len:325 (-),score=35.52 Plantae.Rhodophyta-Palmaria_palmata.ctg7756:62-1036(-)
MYKAERDHNGDVIFPIHLGVLTVMSVGRVDFERPSFHTDRTLYPIGFKSSREYTSMNDVDKTCQYVCEILDGGGPAPVFKVTCMDRPDTPFTSPSPSGCWTNVLTAVRDATPTDRKRLHTNVSGPEYFGLTNALVQELVQGLEGTEKCLKYHRITFVKSAKRSNNRGRSHAVRKATAKKAKVEVELPAVAPAAPSVHESPRSPRNQADAVAEESNEDDDKDEERSDSGDVLMDKEASAAERSRSPSEASRSSGAGDGDDNDEGSDDEDDDGDDDANGEMSNAASPRSDSGRGTPESASPRGTPQSVSPSGTPGSVSPSGEYGSS